MGKKKRRWLWVLVAVLLVWASAGYIRAQYFGPMTCGTSEMVQEELRVVHLHLKAAS